MGTYSLNIMQSALRLAASHRQVNLSVDNCGVSYITPLVIQTELFKNGCHMIKPMQFSAVI